MKENKDLLLLGFGVAVGIVIGWQYNSPYNQCVRAQEYMNKNSKTFVYNFPKEQARVQCAEAFGGRPD